MIVTDVSVEAKWSFPRLDLIKNYLQACMKKT